MVHRLADCNNSGGRFCKLIEALKNFKSDGLALDAWRQYFQVPESATKQQAMHDVGAYLGAGVAELDAMAAALKANRVPDELVATPVSRMKNALSLEQLQAKVAHVIQHLPEDTLVSFRWFAYVLPDEPATFSDEQVKEFSGHIVELRTLLAGPSVPRALADLISRHLDAIERAARLMPICGVGPLKEAVRTSYGDVVFSRAEIEHELDNAQDKEAAKKADAKFFGIWNAAVKLSGDADKLSKGAKLLSQGVDFVQDAIQKLS